MVREPKFWVYVLRCSDGSYYVGSTGSLERRVDLHNAGRASSYTAIRLPTVLVYAEPFESIAQARQRETQMKKWSHAKKEALVSGDVRKLKELSKRRS